MTLHARFAEDERPIPELPGSFEVLVDGIDEIRVGPFEIQSCGQHRLTCRWAEGCIFVCYVEVKVSRHEWVNADDYPDEDVRFIAWLIRRHYASQGGQKLLKLECNAQDEALEDDDGHINAALERSREP